MEDTVIAPSELALPQINAPLIVESAGGVMVPLTDNYLNIDLFARWGQAGDTRRAHRRLARSTTACCPSLPCARGTYPSAAYSSAVRPMQRMRRSFRASPACGRLEGCRASSRPTPRVCISRCRPMSTSLRSRRCWRDTLFPCLASLSPSTGWANRYPRWNARRARCCYCADGSTLIDGISSWWVITHGHCDPRIVKAIQAQGRDGSIR
jgi:hypothetical protein